MFNVYYRDIEITHNCGRKPQQRDTITRRSNGEWFLNSYSYKYCSKCGIDLEKEFKKTDIIDKQYQLRKLAFAYNWLQYIPKLVKH